MLFSRRDSFFVFRPAVEEEALNSIMKDLAALGRCYATAHKPKPRTLSYKQVHEKLRTQLSDLFFFLSLIIKQKLPRCVTESTQNSLAVLSEVVGDWKKKKERKKKT